MGKIVFQSVGNDDWQCKIGRYLLHVEKMDKALWWWAVTDVNFGTVATECPINSTSKKEAMTKCVKAYNDILRHSQKEGE